MMARIEKEGSADDQEHAEKQPFDWKLVLVSERTQNRAREVLKSTDPNPIKEKLLWMRDLIDRGIITGAVGAKWIEMKYFGKGMLEKQFFLSKQDLEGRALLLSGQDVRRIKDLKYINRQGEAVSLPNKFIGDEQIFILFPDEIGNRPDLRKNEQQ